MQPSASLTKNVCKGKTSENITVKQEPRMYIQKLKNLWQLMTSLTFPSQSHLFSDQHAGQRHLQELDKRTQVSESDSETSLDLMIASLQTNLV